VPLNELRPGHSPSPDENRTTPRRQANRTQMIEVSPGVVLLRVSMLLPMGPALRAMTILEQHSIAGSDGPPLLDHEDSTTGNSILGGKPGKVGDQ